MPSGVQAIADSGRPPGRPDLRGFTLIEVLMAIVLIALLGGTLIFGTGMLGSHRVRAAAGLVMSGVRLSASRANSTGRPVRMVFDLDTHRLSIEETADRMLRVKDTGDKGSEGATAGAEAQTEAEQDAVEYADGIIKGPRAPRAKFTPIAQFRSEDGDAEAVGRELGKDILFRAVQTEHDDQPRTKGRAYLYFWPGGGTERAIVQLYRPGDEDGLTVLVSALTGRAKLQRGQVELEEPRRESDFGEREAE
jgi:general secretion pathway protein H